MRTGQPTMYKRNSLSEHLVHSKHVHFIHAEDSPKRVVTDNLPLVTRILEVLPFDMYPEVLDNLWARHLLCR